MLQANYTKFGQEFTRLHLDYAPGIPWTALDFTETKLKVAHASAINIFLQKQTRLVRAIMEKAFASKFNFLR